ncbi:tol-pal system YbgF family protein [Emticicia sp. BO119]|uniref:tetratricopeptide repeat protein n=1 Tax=Emticicia sp. BO119 TaxID=2757768 RepID=UPI0015F08AAD|nr:tetratricopeptide repeat protein [Emticicia sp. BO119]MBA4849283.1 tetratricopeptide repeat protein [Emticicia sp. BO119]
MAQNIQPSPTRGADSLFFNMRYKEAISKYNAYLATASNPLNITYARLAFSNHFTGDYEEAIKYYNLILSKNPLPALKAQLYSRMAMTYAMKMNKEKALVYLDSANANGYLNAYEMEKFKDFDSIRNLPRFKDIYQSVSNRVYPCKTQPRARDFDFWIGTWEVYNNQYPNHRVGTSVVESVSGDCTILENWYAFNSPGDGKSQNWYNPTTGKWTQMWIGSGGGATQYNDGEYKDGAMRFKYTQTDAQGVVQPGNFVFENLGPDKVRQYQDISSDGGKTFNIMFDFIYIRKKS